jgi:hypothetical protein
MVIKGDSQLVIKHADKSYKTIDETMILQEVRKREPNFMGIDF